MADVETETGQHDQGPQRERLLKGRTLAERRRERREALLAAALEVFASKGYASSSVEEICRRAYVSSRNFYEEFDNREDLLCALGDEIAERVYRALTEVEEPPGTDNNYPRTRARVAALVHILLDDPRVAYVAIFEATGINAAREPRRRRAHVRYANWIRDYVWDDLEARGVDDLRKNSFALALVGGANELIGEWVLTPPEERCTVEELIDIITGLAMLVLQR